MRVVEVGQHFVTRNAGEFQQTVACREYTIPRDDQASRPKVWIQGNMRIGPVLEVTTSFQHFKYGIEIRIKSVNQDDSHSWVRNSYGTVKYVTDSIEDNTEILQIHKKSKFHKQAQVWLQPGQRQKQNLNREYSLGRQQAYQYMKEDGLTLSHQNKILFRTISRRKSLIFFDTIQRYSEKKMEQLNFARKFHLRNHHSQIQNWSDD